MTIFRYLFLSILLSLCTSTIAQEVAKEEPPTLGHKVVGGVQSQKEELHRYMGYERLLPKYISLPYDVNANTNVKGAFVDIGYLFLIFLPLILLIGIKTIRWKVAYFFLLLLFYLFSNVTAYCAFHNISVFDVKNHISQVLATVPFGTSPLMNLKIGFTEFLVPIYSLLDTAIAPISGEGDAVTLPLLLLIFVGIISLIWKQFDFSSTIKKNIAYFSVLYGFLWLLLSAGVPWYGMLLTALGVIILGVYYLKDQTRNQLFTKIFLAFSIVWLVFSYSNRLADYDLSSGGNYLGAINTASLIYSTGKYDERQVMDLLYNNYSIALAEINRDPNAIVYRVGTFFHYFIERNNERVIQDNQLGYFGTLSNLYPDKVELTQRLKAANCRFIILDLHTASIDATADKSLTKKYQKFLEFVRGNPAIQMIATDRVVKDGKLEKAGSFAAFKII